MPERKPSFIIEDILKCIRHIQTYTSTVSFDDFAADFMMTEACLYNIQVIGEAVTKLPEELKEQEKQIPWKLIKGMRNRLIHQYFGTDLPLVWNVIKNELPSLGNELERILAQLREKEK